jgi:hypothetical protein
MLQRNYFLIPTFYPDVPHGTDLATSTGMTSGRPSPKKNVSVTELLRAYWAKREARGQEASIPPPLGTDPPTPPISGLAPNLDRQRADADRAESEAEDSQQTRRTPTIPPTTVDNDGIAFAEFRLRLLKRKPPR